MSKHEFGPLPDGPLNVDTKKKFNKLKLDIEIDLMKEYLAKYGEKDDLSPRGSEIAAKWVKLYSDRYRSIFHRKVATDPHFKEDIQIIPSAVYADIKLELYHEDDKVEPEEYIDYGDREFDDDLKKAA